MRTSLKLWSCIAIFMAFIFYMIAKQVGLIGYEITKTKSIMPSHVVYSVEIWQNGHRIYWDKLFYKEMASQDSLSVIVDSIINARIAEYKYWQRKRWGLK